MICSKVIFSENGWTIVDVANAKTSPRVIEMGSAGKAFLVIASNKRVKHKPIRIATKHANVVFQSP